VTSPSDTENLDFYPNVPYTFRAQDCCPGNSASKSPSSNPVFFSFPTNPSLFLKSEQTRSSPGRDPKIIKFESDVFCFSPSR